MALYVPTALHTPGGTFWKYLTEGAVGSPNTEIKKILSYLILKYFGTFWAKKNHVQVSTKQSETINSNIFQHFLNSLRRSQKANFRVNFEVVLNDFRGKYQRYLQGDILGKARGCRVHNNGKCHKSKKELFPKITHPLAVSIKFPEYF